VIRVLVVDDSRAARALVAAALDGQPGLEVVGWAEDGERAVAMASSLRPTVITMDMLMPRLDGVGAIARIMAETPSRILVVSSTADDQQVDLTFRAIRAGALEVIPKPRADDLARWGRRLREAIRLMAEVPVVRRRLVPAPAGDLAPATRVDVFGLVASTGGPPALASILGRMPAGLRVPLLVVQHLATGFTPGLARYLASCTHLRVVVAEPGTTCRGGHVYLPPDGHELEVSPGGALIVSPATHPAGPSGDALLTSIAKAYGARGGGVVLSGMGEDGAAGLLELSRAGGVTAAQDSDTSAVHGMPQAAVMCGATHTLLPPEKIAELIIACAKG
jgi:two-component system chemotaxis response regulator CheB